MDTVKKSNEFKQYVQYIEREGWDDYNKKAEEFVDKLLSKGYAPAKTIEAVGYMTDPDMRTLTPLYSESVSELMANGMNRNEAIDALVKCIPVGKDDDEKTVDQCVKMIKNKLQQGGGLRHRCGAPTHSKKKCNRLVRRGIHHCYQHSRL